MVPEPSSGSTAAHMSVGRQVTAGRDPERLLLTPENVSALGAGLTEAAEPLPSDSPPSRPRRRMGRKGKHKPRRFRKANERSNRAVWSVIPAGHRPARHVIRWLRSFQAIPAFQLARKALKAHIWRFAHALAQCPGFDHQARVAATPGTLRLSTQEHFQLLPPTSGLGCPSGRGHGAYSRVHAEVQRTHRE